MHISEKSLAERLKIGIVFLPPSVNVSRIKSILIGMSKTRTYIAKR